MNNRVAVIGAGPAGVAAAYQLAKKGIQVEIFEADTAVGGMAKTIPLWEQLVDLGPHRFFSSDPRVNKLWLEVVEKEYNMVNRLTRIYYRERFFDYPLKPFNALRGLGAVEAVRCIYSYLSAKLFHPNDASSFEGWVTSRFGSRLFEIFFKSYSEKLWGISCKELDSDFAAQRIKKLSLIEAIKSALIKRSGAKHKTLVEEFAYPLLGSGAVYERMAQKILKLGGAIHFHAEVSSVHPASGPYLLPFIELSDGSRHSYDHIVSSMPITLLVKRMDAPEDICNHAKQLGFRNTILVYLRVDGDSPFPDQWIYVHSPALRTGRITNFKNWVPSINKGQSDTILCLEYWCYDSDEIWKNDDMFLVTLATQEIHATGLVSSKKIKDGKVIRISKCYPVYATGYKNHLKPIEEYLSKQRWLTVIGRYGSFKYNNQDHSILMGILAAENIADGINNNLWELNTDYEYQESSSIKSTGLSNN